VKPFPRLLLTVFFCGAAHAASVDTSGFIESGGCRVLGSESSIARMREISSQGTVTWVGRCVNGLIDGPGVLRHEGVESTESARVRRFAFWLSGTAQAGRRVGFWRRESVNRFEDSPRVWTSLAEIRYVDGAARGAVRDLPVRGPDVFSPAFRALITRFESAHPRETAAAPAGAPPAPAAAPAVTPAPDDSRKADAPASVPAAPRQPPAPSVPDAAPPTSAITPAQPAPATPGTPTPAAPPLPSPSLAHRTLPVGPSVPPPSGAPSRDRGLKHLAPPGTALPAPAPPPLAGQRLLEQPTDCRLERINDHPVGEDWIELPSREALRVTGWAVDPLRDALRGPPVVPPQAWLRIYQRGGAGLLLPLQRLAARKDAAQIPRTGPEFAGAFAVTVESGRLKSGDYSVAIVQRLDNDLAVCISLGRMRLH
jgi:hypothetical protein